jgi:co-chaperonin GroES (HSP10)
MKLRVLHDLVHLKLEPEEKVHHGIVMVRPSLIRYAVVKAVGPGKRWGRKERLVRTEVKPGDRVCVLAAAVAGHSHGKTIEAMLGEDEGIIPERDILFVVEEGNPEVTL